MDRFRWWLRCVRELAIQVVVMMFIEAMLRKSTLPRVCERLGIALQMDGPQSGALGRVPRIFLAQFRCAELLLSRWPFGDTCLRRCLLIGARLSELDPILRIGVRKTDNGLLAHSWLEIDGGSLDPTSEEYATLQTMDGSDDRG